MKLLMSPKIIKNILLALISVVTEMVICCYVPLLCYIVSFAKENMILNISLGL